MTKGVAMAVLAAVLLDCGSAFAQVGGMSISHGPPLGVTSPLGLGSGSPVPPTRIPMGATELAARSCGIYPDPVGPWPPSAAIIWESRLSGHFGHAPATGSDGPRCF
jgi:hypothetical protein